MINGIIHVTGEPDTGKTTFALECGAQPERIWFLDDDVKGRATVQQLRAGGIKFGKYTDLTLTAENRTELEFHQACLEMLKDIKLGDFDAIVWDTWTRFAKTCHPYVLANLGQFRQRWSPMGRIKGAEQWQEAQRYESQILNKLQRLAPTVIVVTHLKDFYFNDAKTDKKVPACSRTLVRVPVFRIWLRHNENSPVPIGLVLKRINKREVTDKGLRTVNVLPRKIVPNGSDQSLWDTIGRYWDEPMGNREPLESEMPDDYELSILDGTLTKDQKRTLELMLKAGAVSEDLFAENDDVTEQVKALKAEGKLPAEIAALTGLTVPEVVRVK